MSATATALIGLACSVIGAIIGYFGFMRSVRKDSEARGKESGAI